ncbi:MAG: fibronectin type III domain-containing protein [Gemmatimonadota bacterium]|nr:fibronectin type III domain-containing protein [Gemmatimonadota bacterium]
MIYARALGPTTARVTHSVVPAATGYQLYRSVSGSSASTLVKSVTVNPNMVLVLDPKAYRGPGYGTGYGPGYGPGSIPGEAINASELPRSYEDPGRHPKASYSYAVVATYPDSGQYQAGTSQVATLTMPPGLPPAGLTATTSSGTTITLRWDPAPDATGYKVFRGDNPTPVTPQPVRGTSYVDSGLPSGLYTYSVITFYQAEGAGEIQGELSPRSSVQVVLSRCVRP